MKLNLIVKVVIGLCMTMQSYAQLFDPGSLDLTPEQQMRLNRRIDLLGGILSEPEWESIRRNWVSGNVPTSVFFREVATIAFQEAGLPSPNSASLDQMVSAILAGNIDQANSMMMNAGYPNSMFWTGAETLPSEIRAVIQVSSVQSTESVANPLQTNVRLVNQQFSNFLFSPATVGATQAEATATPGVWATRMGTDFYYDRTKLDGGGSVNTYGANLSAVTSSGKMTFRGVVPLAFMDGPGFDMTTYGLDVAGKYAVTSAVDIGAHANHLRYNVSGGNDSYSSSIGPMAAVKFPVTDQAILSLAAILDYTDPKSADSYWLGGLGANIGIWLTERAAVNPYVIYFHNLDAPRGLDDDWFDLGADFSLMLSQTWSLTVGAKTSLGFDPFDSSWQIYAGSGWNF